MTVLSFCLMLSVRWVKLLRTFGLLSVYFSSALHVFRNSELNWGAVFNTARWEEQMWYSSLIFVFFCFLCTGAEHLQQDLWGLPNEKGIWTGMGNCLQLWVSYRLAVCLEWLRLEETLKLPQPLPWAGLPPPAQAARGPIQPGLECLQNVDWETMLTSLLTWIEETFMSNRMFHHSRAALFFLSACRVCEEFYILFLGAWFLNTWR